MDSNFNSSTDLPHTRVSGSNTPTSLDVVSRFPTTSNLQSEGCRFQISSPNTPTTPSGTNCNAYYTPFTQSNLFNTTALQIILHS